MKKIQMLSLGVLIITLLVMGVHTFLNPLADWIIRINAILMMIGIFAVSYSTVKCMKGK